MCSWEHTEGRIWGFSSCWGTPTPSDPLACVCIFIQDFEVVLLNASFGCVRSALLQFSLAGAWAGVCLCIPPGQHWSVRPRPLKPGFLFKTPVGETGSGSGLSTSGGPPCCAAPDAAVRMLKQLCVFKFSFYWLFANCDESLLSHGLERRKHTHTRTLIPTFCPVDSPLPACCVSAPLLSSSPYLHLPGSLLFSLPQASSPQHLTFNHLIPPMQNTGCFSTAPLISVKKGAGGAFAVQ